LCSVTKILQGCRFLLVALTEPNLVAMLDQENVKPAMETPVCLS
jgi:hypothetical protein